MIDTKLNQYIRARGLKSRFVSAQLGISYQAFHKKMNGQVGFSAQEALQLKKMLGIAEKDMDEIFRRN